MKTQGSLILFWILLCLMMSAILGGTKSEFEDQAWVDSEEERKQNPNKTGSDYVNEDYENELRVKKAEALRLKQLRDKKKLGATAVKRTLHANSSDRCDLTAHPVRVLQGKLCGAHYKVLQLDRFHDDLDKNTIKKAYRQLSLSVHPDKNPADDATTAFKIIQDAYECLSDDSCKRQYDSYLLQEEERIHWQRSQLQEKMTEKALDSFYQAHKYATKASNFILSSCRKIWEVAGELTIPLYDTDLPLGKIMVSMVVISQFKVTFPLIGLAILIAKVNDELLKNHRQQQYYQYYSFY